MSRSILVTGANGYVGRITIAELAATRRPDDIIVAHDIRLPAENDRIEGISYVQGDIRSAELDGLIAKFGIDTVVHLVSIVTPQKGEGQEFAYSVDVVGTRNLLESCSNNKVKQFIVTSSGAAYGYHADNPEWIVETDALRGNVEFAYSDHKRQVEEMLAEYRGSCPGMKQLVLRPGTILGRTTDNQITDMFKKKNIIGVRGSAIPFVFIWDEDVARIIVKGIADHSQGIYNLAGDGALTLKEIARKLHKRYVTLPVWVLKSTLWLTRMTGNSPYGPEQVNFLRYRPVLLNRKLKEVFGYIPKFTSEEIFSFYMKENLKIQLYKSPKNNLNGNERW